MLDYVVKRLGGRINSKTWLQHSHFAFIGMLSGIGLNDLWRILNLPGNDQPFLIKGEDSGFDMDFLYQVLIGLGLIGLQFFGGVKFGATMGAGVILGSTLANKSEKGRTISMTPV